MYFELNLFGLAVNNLFNQFQTTDLYRVDRAIQVGGSGEGQLFGLKI